MYGKIVNGKLVTPPINAGNKLNAFADKEWLEANGFKELTAEDLAKIKPEQVVRKYSKLKIIETLGDSWPVWKQKIETAGLLDYWQNCAYLASNHPDFQKFYRELSQEEKKLLNTKCIWEEN